MTRVNNCIENRIVVLIGAGSQSTYALQCAQAMKARKIIVVNRGQERLERCEQLVRGLVPFLLRLLEALVDDLCEARRQFANCVRGKARTRFFCTCR